MQKLLTLTLLLSAVSLARADDISISTRQGRGADTTVQSGINADKPLGHMGYLAVKNGQSPSFGRKIYLRFDLAKQPKLLSAAKLSLTLGKANASSPEDKTWTFHVYGLNDGLAAKDGIMGEDWQEREMTWNSAPANNRDSNTEVTSDATELGTFTLTGAGVEGATVTFSSPEMLAYLAKDTDGLVTLILSRQEAETKNGTDDVVHIFQSKDMRANTPATLILTPKTP